MLNCRVFLSYSSKDHELAERLQHALTERGVTVWQDYRELLAGDDIQTRLREAILGSDGLIILLTPSSTVSPWVMLELGAAWATKTPIFPVIYGLTMKEVPEPLKGLNICPLEKLEQSLFPALSRLSKSLERDSELDENVDLAQVAKEAASVAIAGDLALRIIPMVEKALSRDRNVRRQIHTIMQESPQQIREAFLKTMLVLTKAQWPRIRGEAYYCLGEIPLGLNHWMKGESFFREGLSDDSIFVCACCANVLHYFVPLSEETLQTLNSEISLHLHENVAGTTAAKLIYYAHRTLHAHRKIME